MMEVTTAEGVTKEEMWTPQEIAANLDKLA
jgi:hypothetical protein